MNDSLGDYFSEKNNNFNLMRLIAAFSVIYGHAPAVTGRGPNDFFLQLVGYKFIGGVAVDIFFVISGFLITASALGRNGLLYYLMSRFLRIYPALIICVTLSVFVLGSVLTDSSVYWSNQQTWSYLWSNATAFSTEYFLPGVFANAHDKAINGSLWSLAVEVRLYFIVFVLATTGILKNRTFFNLLFFVALLTGYFFSEQWLALFHYPNHLHVAMMFMIGSFAWINRFFIPMNPALLCGLLFFVASQHHTPGFGAAYALLLPYLVFYFAFVPGIAWFNNFSDYSYGVYLYGWIAQQLVLYLSPEMTNTLNTLYGCALALVLATVSWHLIESPALRLKERFKRTA